MPAAVESMDMLKTLFVGGLWVNQRQIRFIELKPYRENYAHVFSTLTWRRKCGPFLADMSRYGATGRAVQYVIDAHDAERIGFVDGIRLDGGG